MITSPFSKSTNNGKLHTLSGSISYLTLKCWPFSIVVQLVNIDNFASTPKRLIFILFLNFVLDEFSHQQIRIFNEDWKHFQLLLFNWLRRELCIFCISSFFWIATASSLISLLFSTTFFWLSGILFAVIIPFKFKSNSSHDKSTGVKIRKN